MARIVETGCRTFEASFADLKFYVPSGGNDVTKGKIVRRMILDDTKLRFKINKIYYFLLNLQIISTIIFV